MLFSHMNKTQACTVRVQESLLSCTYFVKVYTKAAEGNVI